MIRTQPVYRDGTLIPTGPIDLAEEVTVDSTLRTALPSRKPQAKGDASWVAEFVALKERLYANLTEAELEERAEFWEKFEEKKNRRRDAIAESCGVE